MVSEHLHQDIPVQPESWRQQGLISPIRPPSLLSLGGPQGLLDLQDGPDAGQLLLELPTARLRVAAGRAFPPQPCPD